MNHTHILSLIVSVATLTSCSPDISEVFDTASVDVSIIDSIVLKPSNSYLIASAQNEVDLFPVCYYSVQGQRMILPIETIKDEQFVWKDEKGRKVGRRFSTSDPKLAGTQKSFTVSLASRPEIASKPATINIISPEVPGAEKVIPIVFHVIQSTDEVGRLGIVYEDALFLKQLEKLNNVFSYRVTKDATGVDTKIRFAPAVFDPFGNKLATPGIARHVFDYSITPAPDADYPITLEQIKKVVNDAKAVWNPDEYFNVWLISEASDQIKEFAYYGIEYTFLPLFVLSEDALQSAPSWLSLSVPSSPDEVLITSKGLPYRLQDLLSAQNAANSTNELIDYIGYYFGLDFYASHSFPLVPAYKKGEAEYYLKNETEMKENDENFFRSTNIMDDYTGMHTTVSQDQAKVLHWTLENVVGRQFWKSSRALTGK